MRIAGLLLLTVIAALCAQVASAGAPAIQLADTYDPKQPVDLSEYWVSEKLDGVRARWDGVGLATRSGAALRAPAWFTAGWPRVALDGELWIGRGEFESVVATVRDVAPDERAWRRVKFMVFDLPEHGGTFDERVRAMGDLLAPLGVAWLQPIEQFKAANSAELQRRLHETIAHGGEGLMLHRGGAYYTAGRSGDLVKLKLHFDAEARVVGYSEGKGKYRGMLGALIVERDDGLRFKLGTGFSDEQRRRPPPLGALVTYAHQGLTAKGVPRFARFVRVRVDEGL